jgi:hypothetical protein
MSTNGLLIMRASQEYRVMRGLMGGSAIGKVLGDVVLVPGSEED